jgi:hypothetical protein
MDFTSLSQLAWWVAMDVLPLMGGEPSPDPWMFKIYSSLDRCGQNADNPSIRCVCERKNP